MVGDRAAPIATVLWVIAGVCVWIAPLLFSALGMFIGHVLPSEKVTQVIALVLLLCSFAGGLFIPVSHFPHTYAILAKFTPLYGLNNPVHYPVVSNHFGWVCVLNLAVWFAALVLAAVWQCRHSQGATVLHQRSREGSAKAISGAKAIAGPHEELAGLGA